MDSAKPCVVETTLACCSDESDVTSPRLRRSVPSPSRRKTRPPKHAHTSTPTANYPNEWAENDAVSEGYGHWNRHAPRCTRKRNMRSKIWWFTEFCNSHYVSHFAAFFIVARAKISVAVSCKSVFVFHRVALIKLALPGFFLKDTGGWLGCLSFW